MAATALNITIEQGATFSQVITLGTTFNGLTPTGTIRSAFLGNKLVDLTFSAVTAGDTTMSLTAVQTAALFAPGVSPADREVALGVWDMETSNAGVVVRHRQGKVILSREAST